MALSFLVSCLAITAIWITYKLYDYYRVLKGTRSMPVFHCLFSPFSVIGNMFPPNYTTIARGGMRPFAFKHRDFAEKGWNVVAVVAPLPKTRSIIWIADADVIKEVTANRTKYQKPVDQYVLLLKYGENVVTTEGDVWKKHRRISQPAFSEKNNRLVWNAAQHIMTELYDEVWGSKESVLIEHTLDITIRIALMVLSVAAFGKEMSWKTDADVPGGHSMDFTRSLYIVSTEIVATLITPSWLMDYTKRLREIKAAFHNLGQFMDEMIEERKKEGEEKREGRWDLLTNLLAASDEGVDGETNAKLSNAELRGNIFVYLIAGHETTAHTLVYTFGLLAIYQEEQEALHHFIESVIGDRQPTYDDFPNLTRVLAAFYETLRMFPPVATIPKRVMEDTVFMVSSADSKSTERREMYVPRGTSLILHTPGLHYNPRYWPDPYTFKPERFLGEWNRDAFLPFSGGPRSCIGRKFAEVEGVSVLTSLLTRYSVHLSLPQEAEFTGLSRVEMTERLLKSFSRLTLTPSNVPLVFKRRK